MENLLQQLLGILVNSPGNLIYHLTLAFSIFASLQTAVINRRSGENTGRVLLGLNLILIAQLALFLVSGLAWQGIISAHIFLPVFDRAVIVFSLLWIGWMWAFPSPHRIADIVTGFLNLAILILFFFTITEWGREGASLAFNGTWEDWAWSFSGIGVLVLAITAVLMRRPDGWALGFGMAALNLGGLVAHLFIISTSGDFAGFVRLAQLAAYPLLPGLLMRQKPVPEVDSASASVPALQQSGRVTRVTDPRSIHPWVDLNLQTEPARICTGIAHAVAQSMVADLCYVATVPADPHAPFILQSGYDLIREEEVAGTILDQSKLPNITAALTKPRSLRIMTNESRPADLKTLADALGLKEVGNVLVIPLTSGGKPWGGLILLSPYSNRNWTLEDQNFLSSEVESITAILTRATGQLARKGEVDKLKENLAALNHEADDLRVQNQQLFSDISALRRTSAQSTQSQPDIEGLIAVQQDTQQALASLQTENTRLKAMLQKNGSASNADVSLMEKELRAVLQEVARLQNTVVQSNSRIVELEQNNRSSDTNNLPNRENITAIVQELRQPMSSIVGYTDLLLAESIGILGKAQKKFLEHIRSSSERLRSLIDDLVSLTAPANAIGESAHPAVNLTEVIDEAVAEMSHSLLAQRIQLHIDLPEQLPTLYTDRDAVFQITNHLLQNAGSVSPVGGSVSLRAKLHREDQTEYIILQITDRGGGIAVEDLPRVFVSQSQGDGMPIKGIGENASGLTITKTLVDAIGGRIWIDTDPGRGSTFSVLLPIQPSDAQEIPAP